MIRSSFRSAACALSLALLTGSAFAQAPKPAATAQSTAITPSHLAVAREVVIASGMSRSIDTVVPNVERQMEQTLTRTRPELTKDLQQVVQQLHPEFMKMPDEMIDNAAKIVAGAMTEDQLKQTAAFFNSPAGKAYVGSQPVVLQQLLVAMEAWTQQISEQMVTRVRDEMKKRGKDL